MTHKQIIEETLDGTVLFNVPFPKNIAHLKEMSPIILKHPYHVEYLHSYGQDSPWFAGLANKKLLGTECPKCGYKHTTPKLSCMKCGAETEWKELPPEGKVHSFTVCHYGAEEFLKETPFILAMIEFEGWNTLLLSRLVGLDPQQANLKWVGTKVKPKFRRNSKFKPTDVWFVPA
ncbi:MAG: Zn-ribbon domain-containing OB-fold protein [Deltaproteobacteria bacterium]|nr:Zn-ribbon domain-containing OB-fold protein [Deltaproteobacteria bacterium]